MGHTTKRRAGQAISKQASSTWSSKATSLREFYEIIFGHHTFITYVYPTILEWCRSYTIAAWVRFGWHKSLLVSCILSGSILRVLSRLSGRPQIIGATLDSAYGASTWRNESIFTTILSHATQALCIKVLPLVAYQPTSSLTREVQDGYLSVIIATPLNSSSHAWKAGHSVWFYCLANYMRRQ